MELVPTLVFQGAHSYPLALRGNTLSASWPAHEGRDNAIRWAARGSQSEIFCPSTPELLLTPEQRRRAAAGFFLGVSCGGLAPPCRSQGGRGSRPPQKEGWSALPSSLTPPEVDSSCARTDNRWAAAFPVPVRVRTERREKPAGTSTARLERFARSMRNGGDCAIRDQYIRIGDLSAGAVRRRI